MNWLCGPSWPQTCSNLPASASLVLKPWASVSVPSSMTDVLIKETQRVLRPRQRLLHGDRDGGERSTSRGPPGATNLRRGMEVFSRAGEVVAAGLHLDFGFLVQSRAFALATPSACNTLSSLAEPQLLPGLPVHIATVPSNFTFSNS